MNAKELLAHAGKAAAQVFRQNGSVIPILHIVDEFGNHIHLHWASGFENRNAKETTSQIMRKAIKEANAQRYALVMEAWTVDERGDGKLAMEMVHKGLSLEGHPDRIEVIKVFVQDKHSKECLTRTYRILRPEHGKPVLSPPRDLTHAEGEGRFNNLFDEGESQ